MGGGGVKVGFYDTCTYRVRTSSEIKKSRVFQAVLLFFSKAFPGLLKPKMKIITFTTNCLKQHYNIILIVNVITIKQQCAPSVLIQY